MPLTAVMVSAAATTLLLSSKYNALHPRIFHWTTAYVYADTEAKALPNFFASHIHQLGRQDIVWIRSGSSGGHDVKLFKREILDQGRLKQPVYLMTTDGDSALPADIDVCSHAYIRGWYTQNWDGTAGPCARPFPIGLDMHTWHDVDAMIHAQRQSLPLHHRRKEIVWAGHPWPSRMRLLANPSVTKLAITSREKYWDTLGQSMYVASPPGNGMDCHRTWEALYMGCIVLVGKNTLHALYRGLKVIEVQDWARITPQDDWPATPGSTGPDTLLLSRWLPEMEAFGRRQGVHVNI